MSFKITITETRSVKKLVGKEWTVVGTKEVTRDPEFVIAAPEIGKVRVEDVRGYTPEIEKTVVETHDVYEQTVEALDLPAVIVAINQMGRKKRKAK